MAREPEFIEDVEAIKETGSALLCRFKVVPDPKTGKAREIWIPRSQIAEDSDVLREGDSGTLAIPNWLAEREGLV